RPAAMKLRVADDNRLSPILKPGAVARSTTATRVCGRHRFSQVAYVRPCGPPPITTTSKCLSVVIACSPDLCVKPGGSGWKGRMGMEAACSGVRLTAADVVPPGAVTVGVGLDRCAAEGVVAVHHLDLLEPG